MWVHDAPVRAAPAAPPDVANPVAGCPYPRPVPIDSNHRVSEWQLREIAESMPEGAPVVYKWVKNGAGVFALATAVVYIAALGMAALDGAGVGIEVGRRWGATATQTIAVGTTLFVALWAFERVIRAEMPIIAEAMAKRLVIELEAAMVEVAERSTTRGVAVSSAAVRDVVTGDVMAEMLDAAVTRARTYGMVAEARTNVTQLSRRG